MCAGVSESEIGFVYVYDVYDVRSGVSGVDVGVPRRGGTARRFELVSWRCRRQLLGPKWESKLRPMDADRCFGRPTMKSPERTATPFMPANDTPLDAIGLPACSRFLRLYSTLRFDGTFGFMPYMRWFCCTPGGTWPCRSICRPSPACCSGPLPVGAWLVAASM